MTREDKKRNKELCKFMPLDIKIQCWWSRNLDIIAPILSSVVASVVTSLLLMWLEWI